jgi:hypothetical protein
MAILKLDSYFETGALRPDSVVALVKNQIENYKLTFDTIVGTGLSGAVIVPHVGRALGINWALARKPGDGTHSSNKVEGQLGERWIFLDDIICSGATRQRVIEVVKYTCNKHNHLCRFEGSIIYNSYGTNGYCPMLKDDDEEIRPEYADLGGPDR